MYYKELFIVHFTNQSFKNYVKDKHGQIMIGNKISVAALQHVGKGHGDLCSQLLYNILVWSVFQSMWISSIHVPGKENMGVDSEKRISVRELNIKPNISPGPRYQVQPFRSIVYRPELRAYATHTFSLTCRGYFLCIHLFQCVPPVLKKSRQRKKNRKSLRGNGCISQLTN